MKVGTAAGAPAAGATMLLCELQLQDYSLTATASRLQYTTPLPRPERFMYMG